MEAAAIMFDERQSSLSKTKTNLSIPRRKLTPRTKITGCQITHFSHAVNPKGNSTLRNPLHYPVATYLSLLRAPRHLSSKPERSKGQQQPCKRPSWDIGRPSVNLWNTWQKQSLKRIARNPKAEVVSRSVSKARGSQTAGSVHRPLHSCSTASLASTMSLWHAEPRTRVMPSQCKLWASPKDCNFLQFHLLYSFFFFSFILRTPISLWYLVMKDY